MAARHSPGQLLLILFTFVALIVTIVFHYAGSVAGRTVLQIPEGWFINDAVLLNNKYIIKISPSEWIDHFWVFVYFFQLLWVVYSLSLLCRPTADRTQYLYSQGFMPPWLFFVFLLNLTANLGFLFSFDRDQQIAATAMRFVMSMTLIICLALSYRYLDAYGGELLRTGQNIEVYMTRALVHNGIALYLAWVSFLSAMNLGSNMAYIEGLMMKDSCTVSICIIGLQILIYVPLDLLVLDRYMRYTFTPYLSLMVGLSGIVIKSYSEWERNSVLACVMLSVIILGFGFKVGFTLLRRRRWPEPLLYPKKGQKSALPPPPLQDLQLQYVRAPPEQPTPIAYQYPYSQQQPVIAGQPYQPQNQLAIQYAPSTQPVQQSVYQSLPSSLNSIAF